MVINRVAHPVGHGLFYTERFFDDLGNNVFNVVYDCGSNSIDIEPIIDNEFQQNDSIDIVFISHFHDDHISGIPHLLNRCRVKKVVVPFVGQEGLLLSLLHNSSHGKLSLLPLVETLCSGEVVHDTNVLIERIETPSSSIQNHSVGDEEWVYSIVIPPPYKSQATRNNSFGPLVNTLYNNTVFHSIIKSISPLRVDSTLFRSLLNNPANFRWIKSLYRYRQLNSNKYNMLVCSGPKDFSKHPRTFWLMTGDFEANLKYRFDYYKQNNRYYIPQISTIQIPHHGSSRNHNPKLYNNALECFVCDASNSRRIGRVVSLVKGYAIIVHHVSENTTSNYMRTSIV